MSAFTKDAADLSREAGLTPEAKPSVKILIVGAGPSGLLLAILLAKRGIHSTVVEAWDRVDERLRATQYGVPATRVFRRAGILDDIRARSIPDFPYICWRSVRTGEKIAGIDLSVVADDPDRMTILPLNQILEVMLHHCREVHHNHITVLFNHKAVDIQQDGAKAWATVQDTTVREHERFIRFEADYIVGCDGAKSTLRRCLFQRDWPGETFENSLMVQNVFYKGFQDHGWEGGNYMVGPDFWGLITKRGKVQGDDGPLWRVTYGDTAANLSHDEYVRRRELTFRNMLPGHPDPSQYKVTQTDQFRIHNRCVDKMRVGRVFLVGDAAHVCNPFGGYGCMAAVLDAGGLADCLAGYLEGRADEEILDAYAEIRRQKFLDYVDNRSRKNMARVQTDASPESDPFLAFLKSLEGDSNGTREFLLKVSSIEYDFTQLYTRA